MLVEPAVGFVLEENAVEHRCVDKESGAHLFGEQVEGLDGQGAQVRQAFVLVQLFVGEAGR